VTCLDTGRNIST